MLKEHQEEQENSVYHTIEIFIAARKLKDLDYFSKTDPYVKVSYRRDCFAKNYIFLGKTQTATNELNPTFTTSIVLDFIFQIRQDIKFEVFDEDGKNINININKNEDEFIGEVETTVGVLMGAKNQTSILDIMCGEQKRGKLVIRCQQIVTSKFSYEMKWKAINLINTDSYFNFWDKSDPYLKLMKNRADNSWIPAHKTQIVMNDLNPKWKKFSLDAFRLHSKEKSQFKVQCWDWEKSGRDQYIGQILLDIQELKQSQFPKQFSLQNPKYKNPGKLVLENFAIVQKPNLIDYLKGGLELNMMIAIDFTASNGSPTSSTSLHYMSSKKPNHYQTAIKAVAEILMNYDSDKLIPAFGFGADVCYPKIKGLSHCFPLSGDFNNLDCFGIDHLMQLYKKTIKAVKMSGPTYFGPIIEYAAKISRVCKEKGQHVYQTLMILTDGEIHDMKTVIDLIIDSTQLPLSIIVVGVGAANFQNMEKLDGDNGLIGSKGQKATRDIVQFIPFRDVEYNPEVLAKNLLAELPQQIIQYFQNIIKMAPRKPEIQKKLYQFLINQKNTKRQDFENRKSMI